MASPLFATSYFGSVEYFSKLVHEKSVCIDQYEWFQKQTLRNRCIISGPNSILKLVVPYNHYGPEKSVVKDIKISYEEDWYMQHIKSLKTAYNSSPYFEFYKDEIKEILSKKPAYLIELNHSLLLFIIKSLKIPIEVSLSENYIEETTNDYRDLVDVKQNQVVQNNYKPKPYPQVFSHKFDFIPNLSILDLLFNQGPESINYL